MRAKRFRIDTKYFNFSAYKAKHFRLMPRFFDYAEFGATGCFLWQFLFWRGYFFCNFPKKIKSFEPEKLKNAKA